jgi:hypothetical protein
VAPAFIGMVQEESPQREGLRPNNLLEDVRMKKLGSGAQLSHQLQQLQQQFQNVSVRRAPSSSYSGSQAMSLSRG